MKHFVKISTIRKRFGKSDGLGKRSMRNVCGGVQYDFGAPTNPAQTVYRTEASSGSFDQIYNYYGCPFCNEEVCNCNEWNS